MPTKVILPREQKEVVRLFATGAAEIDRAMKERLAEVHRLFNDFVKLCRKLYEVPEDWKFDLDEMAFIPPVEEVKKNGKDISGAG